MSDQPEQSVERTSSSPEQTLDGAWFRRERERVAIGRKSLATKLGNTESRLPCRSLRSQPLPRRAGGPLRAAFRPVPHSLQLPAIEALIRALGMRNVDDSALCLDACLRDVQEAGIGNQSGGGPSPLIRIYRRAPCHQSPARLVVPVAHACAPSSGGRDKARSLSERSTRLGR